MSFIFTTEILCFFYHGVTLSFSLSGRSYFTELYGVFYLGKITQFPLQITLRNSVVIFYHGVGGVIARSNKEYFIYTKNAVPSVQKNSA